MTSSRNRIVPFSQPVGSPSIAQSSHLAASASDRYVWARFVSDAICITTRAGDIVYFNSAFERLFGVYSGTMTHIVSSTGLGAVMAALETASMAPVELARCASFTLIEGKIEETLLDWVFCSTEACEVVLIFRYECTQRYNF